MLKVSQSGILNVAGRVGRLTERTIGKLARKNYYTAKAYYYYKLARADRRHKGPPPLLVYQMGKVGSKTVTESLKTVKIGRPIYHIHSLATETLDEIERKYKSFTHIGGDLKHFWRCQYIRMRLDRGLNNGEKWKILTLVRDPVARNLANFFQHIRVEPSGSDRQWKLKSEWHDFEITVSDNDTKELIEIFFKREEHDLPLIWFDRELKGILDIDVYASDFPISKGYMIYEGKKADVLLIRLEDLNDCAAEAFKEFLNIDSLTLVSANVGGQKDYADIYRAVKDSIVFPEAYLDKIYSSKFAQHFYSEAEIEKFRAKWSKTRA